MKVTVSWTRPADHGSFHAEVDGQDVTSRFQVDDSAMRATASLDLQAGSDPTLTASVVMFRWLPTPGHRRMEAQANFHVFAQTAEDVQTGTAQTLEGFYLNVLPH